MSRCMQFSLRSRLASNRPPQKPALLGGESPRLNAECPRCGNPDRCWVFRNCGEFDEFVHAGCVAASQRETQMPAKIRGIIAGGIKPNDFYQCFQAHYRHNLAPRGSLPGWPASAARIDTCRQTSPDGPSRNYASNPGQ